MDDLDRKILSLLVQNARMPVKEIAEQVSLTSPAVSSRHPQDGDRRHHQWLYRAAEPPGGSSLCGCPDQSFGRPLPPEELLALLQSSREVLQCYHVTGAYTFLIKVSCSSMPQLEHLIMEFQKLGTTSTQIILSTPVQPSGAGCAAAVKNNRSVFTHSSCLFLALNCEQFII